MPIKKRAKFLSCNTEGYAAACTAVRDADFREKIKEITTKMMIIAGKYDLVTTVERAEFMQSNIRNSALKV